MGDATTPVRTDPTGTTTQPVSAASLPLPTGAATETSLGTRAADATITNRLPAGSTPADNESNAITTSRLGSLLWIFDGSTWDRWTGAITGTVTANAGTNLNTSALALDATVTNRLPAGSTPAENESNAITTSRLGAYLWLFDGVTWDRWPGNAVSGAQVNLQAVNGTTVSAGLGIADSGTVRVSQSQEATYSAGTTLKTATAAGTGPWFTICGSATKTIRIQRFTVSGTVATANAYGDVVLKRTSTATSGGTATALTKLPYDSNSAAATAAPVNFYTVLATAGTSQGVIITATQFFPITGTAAAGGNPPLIWMWRDIDSEAPTLRGTAQCMEANFGTTTTNAPTLSVSVAWTEK
jgi:hypothetical protein